MKCFIVAVTFTQDGTGVGATTLGLRVCREPETASASVAAEFVAAHGRGWEMETVAVLEVPLDMLERGVERIRNASPPPGPQGVVPMPPRLVVYPDGTPRDVAGDDGGPFPEPAA
jgi:hypothetical protein